MSAWRRRTLYRAAPGGRVGELAKSAVSGGLYTVWRVRGAGDERVVALLHGRGNAYAWEDTCVDLSTGEEVVFSDKDADVEARRMTLADFPPALLAIWPNHEGRPIVPGPRDNGPKVGERELKKLAGKVDLAPAQPALF